jgi:hypothetical protein
MQWKVMEGALTYRGRIYVPEALRKQVIVCHFHETLNLITFVLFRLLNSYLETSIS